MKADIFLFSPNLPEPLVPLRSDLFGLYLLLVANLDDPRYLFGADLRKAQFPTAMYSIAYSARFYTANLGEPWVFLGTVIHDTRLPKAQNDRFLAPKTFFLRI